MKTLLSFLFLLITTSVFAQKHPFIRVFTNINGKTGKTIRGKLTTITDSSITVKGKTISYHDIYMIKTKRSFGHSLWTYTLGGLGFGLVSGTIALKDTRGPSAGIIVVILPVLTTPAGAVVGTAIGATNNVKTMYIYNNLEEWQIAKATLVETTK